MTYSSFRNTPQHTSNHKNAFCYESDFSPMEIELDTTAVLSTKSILIIKLQINISLT